VSSIKPLAIHGLVPSPDFPAADFEAIYTKINPRSSHSAHIHFVGAWSAISYRYRAVTEYEAQFTASIVRDGPGPGQPIRYEQERDLFNFFSSGVSVFDAFCFGAFSIGAHTGSTDFQLVTERDQRKVNWKRLIDAYTKSFANDPITPLLNSIDTDGALNALRVARSILMHRAVPPRQFRVAIGPMEPVSTINQLNLTLDQNTTTLRRKEIDRLLSLGLSGMRTFVDARF
jgi:hypothetical protein